MDTLKVRDAKDVEQVVRAAIASEQPLEIIGHGTRRQIGQPMATNALLELSALNAVTAYEPNELIITVQAGAPLADVQSLIDSKNQQFAFEPVDTSALLGVPGTGTIGGMIGAGLAGPRRIKAGGARDHLLGAHAVSGFGDSFQDRRQGGEERHRLRSLQIAGGVMGHAGGHDRSDVEGDAETRERTHAGAARARRSHRQPGDDRRARLAVRRLRRGASAEFGVPARGRRAWLASARRGRRLTLLRLEGIAASVADRANSLGKTLAPFGAVEILQDDALGRDLEFDPRRPAVCGRRRAGRVAGVADRLSAGLGRRARPGPGARHRG